MKDKSIFLKISLKQIKTILNFRTIMSWHQPDSHLLLATHSYKLALSTAGIAVKRKCLLTNSMSQSLNETLLAPQQSLKTHNHRWAPHVICLMGGTRSSPSYSWKYKADTSIQSITITWLLTSEDGFRSSSTYPSEDN